MAKFNIASDYSMPMERSYHSPLPASRSIEEPIGKGTIGVSALGKSVTEGRGEGTFLDSVKAAIFEGASTIELSAKGEGAEPFVGLEAYGREARQDLKELAAANKVIFTSVHTPPEVVGNLSGFGRDGFNPQIRDHNVNEIKKAIEFAADAGARAVVVHTGEFQRPFIDSEGPAWKDEKGRELFRNYLEEPTKGIVYLVDETTGQIIQEVRRNMQVARPRWLRADKDDVWVDEKTGQKTHYQKGDFINFEGKPVYDIKDRVPEYDESTRRFKVDLWTWGKFVKEAEEHNKKFGYKQNDPDYLTPEKAFINATLEANEAQARGWELYFSDQFEVSKKNVNELRKMRDVWKKIEDGTPTDEKWKLMEETSRLAHSIGARYLPSERKLPTEIIDNELRELRSRLEHIKESSISYAQQAREVQLRKQRIQPLKEYALNQSAKSLAEAGIFAMKQTSEKKLKDPVFVAPENIFPEMGYGSHPQEIVEIVKRGRERMINYLTADMIPDPTDKKDEKGNPVMIKNPYKISGLNKNEALQRAEQHIKSTLDTQHLGMWWRYFQPRPNETEEQTRKRFNQWYLDQVKMLEKEKVIGHMHIVDGFGRGHTHLVAGEGAVEQGKKGAVISPVISAVEYLKKKGYAGTMISEAFGGVGRGQLTKTWAAFGSPIYSVHMGPLRPASTQRWSDVQHSYFGYTRTPYFIFGAYSPSEEFKLWSEVPME